jgi:hypothetical protein
LIPGVTHGYHEKKSFFFRKSKLDVLVDSGVLITNIIMRAIKTFVFVIIENFNRRIDLI